MLLMQAGDSLTCQCMVTIMQWDSGFKDEQSSCALWLPCAISLCYQNKPLITNSLFSMIATRATTLVVKTTNSFFQCIHSTLSQYFQVNRVAAECSKHATHDCTILWIRQDLFSAEEEEIFLNIPRTNTNKKLRNVPGEPTLQTLLLYKVTKKFSERKQVHVGMKPNQTRWE